MNFQSFIFFLDTHPSGEATQKFLEFLELWMILYKIIKFEHYSLISGNSKIHFILFPHELSHWQQARPISTVPPPLTRAPRPLTDDFSPPVTAMALVWSLRRRAHTGGLYWMAGALWRARRRPWWPRRCGEITPATGRRLRSK
jgi:hypothetical protein